MKTENETALGSPGLLEALVPVPEAELGSRRPEIRVDGRQLDEITQDALDAVRLANSPPRLFRRGGSIVRLRGGSGPELAVVERLDVDSLRGVLARAATWYVEKSGKSGSWRKGVFPPLEVVKDLLSQPESDRDSLPPLEGVIECPAFSHGGTLLDMPGYDPESRLWYSPGPDLDISRVPKEPSWIRGLGARQLLQHTLLGDFPFADQASRANALALLLLPFVRPMIDGPTPFHLIEAPRAGTGKGLLANVIHMIATGRPAAAMTEVAGGDEWKKIITATLLEAPALVLIDNINGYLDSGALASALTARSVKGRILGCTKMVDVPVRCVWVGTGNNVRMSGELARRTPLIRLVPQVDQPWMRPASSFRQPDLLGYVGRNRGRLIHAALTLCRAWVAAGMPRGEVTVGSFESWSRTMGGILDVIGVPGFMANALTMQDDANDDHAKWSALVRHWWQRFQGDAVAIADLFPMVEEAGLLEGILGDGNEASRRIRLGRALGKQRDACYEGRKIIKVGLAPNGSCLHRLAAQPAG